MFSFLIISRLLFFYFSRAKCEEFFKNPTMLNNIFIYLASILIAWNLNFFLVNLLHYKIYYPSSVLATMLYILSQLNWVWLALPENTMYFYTSVLLLMLFPHLQSFYIYFCLLNFYKSRVTHTAPSFQEFCWL